MPVIVLRVAVVVLLSLLAWLLVRSGKYIVEKKRQRALDAALPRDGLENLFPGSKAHVRILAFGSEDCRQCHQFQMPALRRVVEARNEAVTFVEIDAPSSPELTQRYQVLTVPTTVVLDADGKAHAVNYGFTNVQRLLQQVDELLETSSLK